MHPVLLALCLATQQCLHQISVDGLLLTNLSARKTHRRFKYSLRAMPEGLELWGNKWGTAQGYPVAQSGFELRCFVLDAIFRWACLSLAVLHNIVLVNKVVCLKAKSPGMLRRCILAVQKYQ